MGGQQSSRFALSSFRQQEQQQQQKEKGNVDCSYVRRGKCWQYPYIPIYPQYSDRPIACWLAVSAYVFYESLLRDNAQAEGSDRSACFLSDLPMCVCMCVCCHCLAYFAVFYVISRLTYWFQCAPSPVSRFRAVKISARRRPALGGPAWTDPGSQCPSPSRSRSCSWSLCKSRCHSDSGNTYHSPHFVALLSSKST